MVDVDNDQSVDVVKLMMINVVVVKLMMVNVLMLRRRLWRSLWWSIWWCWWWSMWLWTTSCIMHHNNNNLYQKLHTSKKPQMPTPEVKCPRKRSGTHARGSTKDLPRGHATNLKWTVSASCTTCQRTDQIKRHCTRETDTSGWISSPWGL